ncbi:MAG: hypothetical protein K9G64_04825 [Bacteroidia bacterium]|nr:hypothetical protein [Bacteroidia bacterium]
MKKQYLIIGITCLSTIFTSCTNQDAALKEKQAIIDSLTLVINGTSNMLTTTSANDLSQPISYQDAITHIAAFKGLNTTDFSGVNVPIAAMFDKNQIETLLSQNNCVGLKLYTSVYNNNLVSVAIGVKEGQNLGTYTDLVDSTDFKGLNFSKICPTMCDVSSPLYNVQ